MRALNFSGHGGRPFADRFDAVQFAGEVLAFMDEEGVEQADLFGYSMGGYVALTLARLHPQRVGRIATLATKFDWTPEGAAREAGLLDPGQLEAKVPQYAEALRRRHGADQWQELLAATAELMLDLGDRPLLVPAILGTIEHVVLCMVGDADRLVSRVETADAAAALPNGRMLVLPDTPHPLEKVDTGRLVEALRGFFGF